MLLRASQASISAFTRHESLVSPKIFDYSFVNLPLRVSKLGRSVWIWQSLRKGWARCFRGSIELCGCPANHNISKWSQLWSARALEYAACEYSLKVAFDRNSFHSDQPWYCWDYSQYLVERIRWISSQPSSARFASIDCLIMCSKVWQPGLSKVRFCLFMIGRSTGQVFKSKRWRRVHSIFHRQGWQNF